MVKLFFILVGLVGSLFLINAYAPDLWHKGFNAFNAHIPFALCILGAILVTGIVKLSSK
jgi:hypothetical protein